MNPPFHQQFSGNPGPSDKSPESWEDVLVVVLFAQQLLDLRDLVLKG